jgi:hypothetical protein
MTPVILAKTLLRFALSLYPKFLFNLSAFGFFEKATKMYVDAKENWAILYMKRNGSISIESF